MDTKLLLEYTKDISVLFVDDDSDIRESFGELLSSYFKELVTAVDGVDALNKFANKKFDLIISDINMPNMDGIEMAKKIQNINPELPIIFISAHHEISYLQGAIDIGVSSFISKPLDKNKLDNAIFKASQAISDHKFVLQHMDLIEDLNIQLENQNNELKDKNNDLEKSIRLLDTMVNKEQITHTKSQEIEVDNSEDNKAIDIQIQQLMNEDLHELREIHLEMDRSVINIINLNGEIPEDEFEFLVKKFKRYASILSYYHFFNKLAFAMRDFASNLQSNTQPDIKEDIENIFMLLESFLYVLQKWQNEIENGNKEMINFFDSSIINDMTTITNMWIKTDSDENNFGDMEFF